ncbi:MAG: hypothetical protein HFF64_00670 [Oscillospiraceae bacterium]|nr:hypothetical protein [Oscillospiraceae bacterium]
MLELYIPAVEDLWFRQAMEADPATMAYNAGWDVSYDGYHPDTGCIDLPEPLWPAEHARLVGREPEQFYAFVREIETGAFVGEVNFQRESPGGGCGMGPRIEITRQDIEMLYGESVFEEKRESRSQNRGKRRRSGRGAAARPQERRTLELMPIGNRLAAGGEELADTEAGQAVSEPVLTPPQSVGSQFQNPSMAGNSAVGDISAMTAPSAMAGSSSMADTSAMADASAMADTSAIVTEEELEALLKEFLTS